MQHQLYGLRGNAYKLKYLQLYEELKDQIKEDVIEIKHTNGKFTLRDLGRLCMKYRVPLTAMDDYLNSIFPVNPSVPNEFEWTRGTWELSGRKAKEIGVVWD